MTPTKQTVYFPTEEALKEGFSSSDFDRKTGYFFTPEQLNEYTANVVRQALETAAEKIVSDALETCGSSVPDCWNKESITNTLEETCKKFEV